MTSFRCWSFGYRALADQSGADCNKSGIYGTTPLCEASRTGHVDIVDMLIKGGADCNKSGEDDTTPLCEISCAGLVDIADMLIKGGADCNKSAKMTQLLFAKLPVPVMLISRTC